jgi:hypothetical protein
VHGRMLRAASEHLYALGDNAIQHVGRCGVACARGPFAVADRLERSLGGSAVPSRVIQLEPGNGWRRDGGRPLAFCDRRY